MRVSVNEYEHGFEVDLEAENMEEAAKLTRMGMNTKKEITSMYTCVSKGGAFQAEVGLKKSRKESSVVPKRK